MKRDTLHAILGRIPDMQSKKDRFDVGAGHHVALYVGQPGQAMVIGDIGTLSLESDVLMAQTRETATAHYLAYDDVHALTHRAPERKQDRRAGFT